ncbi:MAG: efflux RND transporter periplasmic adaptor subunit, partial [Armatimonadetes bacterium]|nr:efflux RND transporter periplasmic adaptor subunit [Armatimonadota bacterium]
IRNGRRLGSDRNKMKKQIQLWGTRTLSVALVVIAAQLWGTPLYKQYFIPKKVAVFVPSTKVLEGAFAVSFHEMGNLEAVDTTQVVSQVTGRIIKLVPEGTVVKAGDVLVELDTTDIQREIRKAELAYQNALAEVARTKSEMDILKATNETDRKKAQAQYDFDKNELDRSKQELARQKRLADEKLVPGSAVDKAEFDVRSKELALTKSDMDNELKATELKEKEGQQQASIRKVEFAANIALSELDEAKSNANKSIIKAPAAGMVVLSSFWSGDSHRKFKEGDQASPKGAICNLPNLSSMNVTVKVGEADVPKLRIGLQTVIHLEAIPNKTFHGTLQEISSLAMESNPWEGDTPGRKNFDVVIALKEADPKTIRPGMTADVEFICDSIAKAVYVPLEAVIEQNNKTWVFVKKGKSFERKAVELGKSNDNFVIVKKGLSKGEEIALRDPTKPTDDQDTANSAEKTAEKTEKKKAIPIPGE